MVARELAAALDDRARALGERQAASPEPWLARQSARSYSLMRPPRRGRRWIRFAEGSADTAVALRRQPSIQAAVSRWRKITVAAVAVGSWDPEGSQVYDVLTGKDRAELAGLDVVCEICSIPFAPDGRPVPTTLTQRTMAIPYADLERIPEVIAVAGGEPKTDAVRAVLRGRAVTSVVTDSAVAARLLAQEPPTRQPRR